MKTKLILPLALLFILVSTSVVNAATPKPSPKNFGQSVKQLRKDTNVKKKALQQKKKAGTITKQEFKAQKKALQQDFKTKKKSLKSQFTPKPKASPALLKP